MSILQLGTYRGLGRCLMILKHPVTGMLSITLSTLAILLHHKVVSPTIQVLLGTVENRVIKTPEEFNAVCTRMNNYDMKSCPGIDADYCKQCREVIHYEVKNVRVTESPMS